MKQVDLNSCFEILNKKPKWFFEEDNIAEKLGCFETIQKFGTPALIYSLIKFLKNGNGEIRQKSAETILYLFSQLRSQIDFADSLKHLHFELSDLDYYEGKFDNRTYVTLLSVASFNGSGYIREKAVKLLEKNGTAEGIKSILLRLGDWVIPVRQAAAKALKSFLTPVYIDELLKQLPIIDSLLGIKRTELTEIHNSILSIIFAQTCSESFFAKIELLSEKARLIFYKKYLAAANLSEERLIKIGQDKNFLIRLEALRHAAIIGDVFQTAFVEKLLTDKSAKVRLSALYIMKPRFLEFESEIYRSLSDESASVRELSRYILKSKSINFAEVYRNRLKGGEYILGNLSGLAETGTAEDLQIFEKNIHTANNQVIIVCLNALNRLNVEIAKQYAFIYLKYPTAKVRGKAMDILSKNGDASTLENIRKIYINGSSDTKKTVLKLYGQIGGWSIVGDLLIGVNDIDADIQNLSWQMLEKWRVKATNLFTVPNPKDIERVFGIYQALLKEKQAMPAAHAKLLKEVIFFFN